MRRPIDTSVEARKRQLDAYRAMAPEDRLRLADEMSTDIRSLARSGIQARVAGDPAEGDIDAEVLRIVLDPDDAAAFLARRSSGRR